ncbi:hypothetical protein, partial [Rhizocola hellebori]|uniref:hypothetical protein n=1 Tax=Rhizocola hellebori TaxID=1392758 RepID=UPI0019449C19
MKQEDGRGVGICLGESGAVIAVARSHPPRLIALASVSWPHGQWRQPGPSATARRMLVRARRQLALPRWHPVSVVIGPSLAGQILDDTLAASAELFARAGWSQAWITTPDRAETLRRQVTVAPGELGAAAAGKEAGLAIGAALTSLAPPPTAIPPVPVTITPPTPATP